ncbi:MAG: hypothetical protein NTY38_18005 [Acidobacteria bacterium]|nr:hypothetical protein [Acidobacteriota bacterium]
MGPEMVEEGVGPSSRMATKDGRPSTSTLAAKVRPLRVAPTLRAEGAEAGEPTVFAPGPLLPAATTTRTPAREAVSMACTSISSSRRGAKSSPMLRLMMSMPSATASSMALRMAASLVESL